MNVAEALYPYVLAVANIAIGWLSYDVSRPGLAVPFLAIGLLVFAAVVGQTLVQYTPLRCRTERRREEPW